jgi:hypothetical protein
MAELSSKQSDLAQSGTSLAAHGLRDPIDSTGAMTRSVRPPDQLEGLLLQSISRTIIGLVFCLAVLIILRHAVLIPFSPADWPRFALAIAVIALLGSTVRLRIAPTAFKIVFRTIIGLFTLYLTLHTPAILDTGLVSTSVLNAILVYGRWIAVACGVAALFRPSFGLITLTYVYWQKLTIQASIELWITPLDYIAVLEGGLFLIICILTYDVCERRLKFRLGEMPSTFLEAATLGAIALHFGNYFYSGIEKIKLGDYPLTWVFENKTHSLILAAFEARQLPISIPEWMAAYTFRFMDGSYIWLNALVLLSQLLCLLAIQRLRWIAILTFFYDITHAVIFLTSGIFFWKWILYNASIVVAVGNFRQRRIPPQLCVFLIGIIIASPDFAHIARLGWFDTRSINDSYLEAVTQAGESYRVPSNFFGSLSILFTTHAAGAPFSGHFATGNYGTTTKPDIMRKANQCALSTAPRTEIEQSSGRAPLNRMVQAFHRWMLGDNPNGLPHYDLFPHHIWSNPLAFRDFASLDKRSIDHYRLVVESVCVSVQGSHIVEEAKLKGSYDIPLKP